MLRTRVPGVYKPGDAVSRTWHVVDFGINFSWLPRIGLWETLLCWEPMTPPPSADPVWETLQVALLVRIGRRDVAAGRGDSFSTVYKFKQLVALRIPQRTLMYSFGHV